jgi:hypothetical protein
MPSFTMTHEFDCDVERFWKIFHDPEVTKKTYEHLGFPKWELVETKDTDKEIVRKVKAVPKLEMPGPVAKLLGDGFGYTEEGRFDKEKKTYKFVITPSKLSDKLKNEGVVRAEAIDGGKRTKRIVDVTIEAKVFGVGGMIEKTTEKGTREGWDAGAKFLNDWIKKNPE